MLNAREILDVQDFEIRKIFVTETWGHVWIRTMNGLQRDEIEELLIADKRTNVRGLCAIFCICDQDGNRFFTKADLKAMNKKSGKALDQVFAEVIALNRMSEDDVDELEKKVAVATSDSSPIGGQEV
jgi:hypothetical protein